MSYIIVFYPTLLYLIIFYRIFCLPSLILLLNTFREEAERQLKGKGKEKKDPSETRKAKKNKGEQTRGEEKSSKLLLHHDCHLSNPCSTILLVGSDLLVRLVGTRCGIPTYYKKLRIFSFFPDPSQDPQEERAFELLLGWFPLTFGVLR